MVTVYFVNCIVWTFDTGRIDYFVILFWLISNLYNIVMSIFFILGRKSYRKYERMLVREKCEVTNGIVTAKGYSKDASEGGISVVFKEPVDFDDDEVVEITMQTEGSKIRIKGQTVLVKQFGDEWRYVFAITDMLENKAEYIFTIYDNFTVPIKLSSSRVGSISVTT